MTIEVVIPDKFQSLIHQVSVSFSFTRESLPLPHIIVSIPYSSGQCFFLAVIKVCYEVTSTKFQSLIHQVSVSFLSSRQE